MKRCLLFLLFALGLCLLPGIASAQTCTFSATAMPFSGSIIGGSVLTSTSTVTASCSGVIGYGTSVLVCPDLNEGSGGATSAYRQMLNGTSTLNYQLYSDSARTTVWGSATWSYAARPPGFIVLLTQIGLSISLTGSGSATVYGSIPAGQTTSAAGTYTSVFSGTQAAFRYRYNDSLGCSANSGTAVQTSGLTVSMTVAKELTVSAQAIDFGTRGVLNANIDQTGQVSVLCTPSTSSPSYDVALSAGNNALSGVRRMIKGTEYISYGLYKDAARSVPWTAVSPGNTNSGTCTGVAINLPVYARIPSQKSPTPGLYSDTIVVTVTY
jgi:spore coat protein U-like protein